MQVNTRNGIFANEGYGGGLFNLNVGFGRAPEGMPSGIAGLGRVGLGATDILDRCKDDPAYKDCKDGCVYVGRQQCEYDIPADYPEVLAACIQDRTLECAYSCVPTCLKVVEPQEGEPCGSEEVIMWVQSVIGTKVDGQWGPDSQEKYDKYVEQGGLAYRDIAYDCVGPLPFAEVEPGPAPGPVVVACPPGQIRNQSGICVPAAVTPTKPKSQMAWLAVGGLAAAAVAIGVYSMSKKGK